jgi:hypothetical protein
MTINCIEAANSGDINHEVHEAHEENIKYLFRLVV